MTAIHKSKLIKLLKLAEKHFKSIDAGIVMKLGARLGISNDESIKIAKEIHFNYKK